MKGADSPEVIPEVGTNRYWDMSVESGKAEIITCRLIEMDKV